MVDFNTKKIIEKMYGARIDDCCLFGSIVFFVLFILDWDLDYLFFAGIMLCVGASIKKRKNKKQKNEKN